MVRVSVTTLWFAESLTQLERQLQGYSDEHDDRLEQSPPCAERQLDDDYDCERLTTSATFKPAITTFGHLVT